jgi:carboxylesterase type B
MQDYAIHFFSGFDPNFGSTLTKWPKYTLKEKELLVVTNDSLALEPDTYREDAITVVQNIFLQNPI